MLGKRILYLATIVALLGALGAWAGGKDEQTQPVQTTVTAEKQEWSLATAAAPYKGQTVKVIFEPWAGMQAFEGPAEEFERITGITVDIEYADYEERQIKTKSDFIAGTHIYDFSMVSFREVGINVENDWVEPIDKFLNDEKLRDPSFDPWKLLAKPVVETSSLWKGTYYGVPCFQNIPIVIFRKDIAENEEERVGFKAEYGYELPVSLGNYFPFKDYKQYKDVCEYFTRKKGEKLAGKVLTEDFYGYNLGFKQHPTAAAFLEMYWVNFGAWYYDDKGNPTLNSPGSVAALELMLSLRPYIAPGYLEATWDENFNEYANGHVFMYTTFPDTFAFIEDPNSSKVAGLNGYFMNPVVRPGGYNNITDIVDWVIWKSSRHKEAAYLFIQYLSSFDAQLAVQRANGCTFHPEVMALPEIQERYPWFPATLELIKREKQEGGHLLTVVGYPWIPAAYDIMAEMVSKAGANMVTAQEAMDEVQERVQNMLAD